MGWLWDVDIGFSAGHLLVAPSTTHCCCFYGRATAAGYMLLMAHTPAGQRVACS